MVQLSVNVDGQKGDQVKKTPDDSVQVAIPAAPGPVAVKRGRCCGKTAVCVSVIGVFILLVAGAALLGVYRSRHKSWQDCFKWDDSTDQDSGSHSGGESHGGWSHGGGSHGGGSHGGGSDGGGHHGGGSHGNWTHGGHGGHGGGGHGGRPWPHDGDGGHGGEEHDGGGRRYPGNEGDHFPDGRP